MPTSEDVQQLCGATDHFGAQCPRKGKGKGWGKDGGKKGGGKGSYGGKGIYGLWPGQGQEVDENGGWPPGIGGNPTPLCHLKNWFKALETDDNEDSMMMIRAKNWYDRGAPPWAPPVDISGLRAAAYGRGPCLAWLKQAGEDG